MPAAALPDPVDARELDRQPDRQAGLAIGDCAMSAGDDSNPVDPCGRGDGIPARRPTGSGAVRA